MLNEDQRRFLESRRVAHLATADAGATPHVVPVCFALHENAVYVTIDQKPKGNPRSLKAPAQHRGEPLGRPCS